MCDLKNNILSQYDTEKSRYEKLRVVLKSLCKDWFEDEQWGIFEIQSRIKDRDNLAEKIDRKNKYQNLTEITDVCGLRIITSLESSVDKVAEKINNELKIDASNSVDKRVLRVDQFGYRSLHYVVELNEDRCKLSEYALCQGIKAEIQIRSILQHAWANLMRNLGYNTKYELPLQFHRNFNRMAALLETADIEFDRLNNQLAEYKSIINQSITQKPEDVFLDKTSLESYSFTNPTVKEARDILAELLHMSFYEFSVFAWDDVIRYLTEVGINTISDLDTILNERKNTLFSFMYAYTETLDISVRRKYPVHPVYPIFCFSIYLLVEGKSEKQLFEYYDNSTDSRLGAILPALEKMKDIHFA